jgi:hypothetical protein
MPTFTEAPRSLEFLVREFDKLFNRETGVLISGQNLQAGAVLGRITASGKYTALAPTASDGSQNAAAILLEATDASTGDKPAALLVRGPAVVSQANLIFAPAVTGPQKTTAYGQLTALGIVPRLANAGDAVFILN